MVSLATLETFLQGCPAPRCCEDEQAYYALWRTQAIDALAPAGQAIAGALLADRLPWVFAAGYQATLRNAFPALPSGGWAAFVANEDVHDPLAHPGTSLHDDGERFLLNGDKSWVAHSKLVDHLIVTVNDPFGDKRRARGIIVARERAGVELSHREHATFLGAMSQGYAHFSQVAVSYDEVFEFEPILQFGRTEAKFVMLAAASFMLTRTMDQPELSERILTVCAALLALLAEAATSRQVYAGIERCFQHCVDDFEQVFDTTTIPGYTHDRRLFRMYHERIQRRAEYARAAYSSGVIS